MSIFQSPFSLLNLTTLWPKKEVEYQRGNKDNNNNSPFIYTNIGECISEMSNVACSSIALFNGQFDIEK